MLTRSVLRHIDLLGHGSLASGSSGTSLVRCALASSQEGRALTAFLTPPELQPGGRALSLQEERVGAAVSLACPASLPSHQGVLLARSAIWTSVHLPGSACSLKLRTQFLLLL